MKFIYLLLLTIFINTIYSQTLKVYTGKYENGTASYEYYENAMFKKVKNGNFKYEDRNIEITGKFDNDKKKGEWIYSRKNVHYNDHDILIKGNYIDGMKDGMWTFYRYFSDQNGKKEYKATINFLNDILIGSFDLQNIIGEFDKGKFVGKWTYKGPVSENIVEFEDNIVAKFTEIVFEDNSINELYKPKKDSLLYFVKDTKKLYQRVRFDKEFIRNDFIYGKNPNTAYGVRNNFIGTMVLFYISLVEKADGLLNTKPFIELEKIKIPKPEILILKSKIPNELDERIYDFESSKLDKQPVYEGGKTKFFNYLVRDIEIPEDENFKGDIVKMSFVIEKDGSISTVKFEKDLGYGINEKLENALKKCKKWKPGTIDNENVRVAYSIALDMFID